MRPREKAPRTLAIQDPITFPKAREGCLSKTDETMTANWDRGKEERSGSEFEDRRVIVSSS